MDDRLTCTLTEVLDSWSIVDLYEAHVVLNELDRVTELARNRNGSP